MSGAVNAIGASGAAEAALGRAGVRVDHRQNFEESLIKAHTRAEERWNEKVEEQKKIEQDPERYERAQKGAEQLVAATFIVPILQQLRESNMAAEPFGPGSYEKQMGPMIDAQIADRIVSAQNLPMVAALRDRMLGLHDRRMPEGSADAGQTKQGAA